MPGFVRITWKVCFDAFWHFTEDDGWAMASHVALSALLAIFPFLIFGTTLATFLGADQFSETAVHLIFDNLPATIADPIAREVTQVLTIPRGGLLTISVLAAFYFASNGVEALRISLNRAYRVVEPRRGTSPGRSAWAMFWPRFWCWSCCRSSSSRRRSRFVMPAAGFPGPRIC